MPGFIVLSLVSYAWPRQKAYGCEVKGYTALMHDVRSIVLGTDWARPWNILFGIFGRPDTWTTTTSSTSPYETGRMGYTQQQQTTTPFGHEMYHECQYIVNQMKGGNLYPLLKEFFLKVFCFIFPPMGFILKACANKTKMPVKEHPPFYNETYYKFDNEKWFFIGGLGKSEEIQRLNAAHIAKCVKRRVHVFHNPSYGLLFDLIQCMFARTFSYIDDLEVTIATKLYRTLKKNQYTRVIVVAHAEGGPMVANALKLLAKWDVPLEKLEVYTFGSAAVNIPASTRAHIEHYANVGDYIAKVGIRDCKKERAGPLFKYEMNEKGELVEGNLLGAHYLPNIEKKRYVHKSRQPRLPLYWDGNIAPALRPEQREREREIFPSI